MAPSSSSNTATNTALTNGIPPQAREQKFFTEGTEVTTVTKGSYVGKIKRVKKAEGNKVKYQIDWFGHSAPSAITSNASQAQKSRNRINNEWYDHSTVKKFDTKRTPKINKRWSLQCKQTSTEHLVSEKEKIRIFKEAKYYLLMMPCDYPIDAVNDALHEEGYPYGLQGVMGRLINKVGKLKTRLPECHQTKLKPIKSIKKIKNDVNINISDMDLIGKIIRRSFDGIEHEGRVIQRHEDGNDVLYQVKYDDGDVEDLDGFEVMRFLHPRLEVPSCLGRRLQCLELFAGTCIVSDAFYYREWDVIASDNNPDSNATIKRDVLLLEPKEDFDQVPDFIWASPPCETYSRLSGGYHRSIKDDELDRSPAARLHNYIFMKMVQILVWAKAKHPHLIVVIENPVGKLKHMPLMIEFERHFNLKPVTVHYCTFGRDEQKATLLWTNYPSLGEHLADFKCDMHRCSVGRKHLGVRSNTKDIDFSSIPEPLAREVSRVVDAKLTLDRVHRFEPANPRPGMGANSSLLLEESRARNCHYPLTAIPSNSAILKCEVD